MSRHTTELSPHVAAAADTFLSAISFDEIDPKGSVTPTSRRLCAGLGALSQATYRALDGTDAEVEARVGLAGAMLSLLTKLDDQVIDAAPFHAGLSRDQAEEKTRAYLAPSLRAIYTGRGDGGARTEFAAAFGRRVTGADDLLATISLGWEVQARAVGVLTRHASEVAMSEVEAVTRDISGVWLRMIAEVGAAAAPRKPTPSELAAFQPWGDAIQKADALNDLKKDIGDGHWSAFPLKLLFERSPEAYAEARAGGEVDALLAQHDVPRACLRADLIAEAREAHAGLGEVPEMLGWIHRHLTARWAARLAG